MNAVCIQSLPDQSRTSYWDADKPSNIRTQMIHYIHITDTHKTAIFSSGGCTLNPEGRMVPTFRMAHSSSSTNQLLMERTSVSTECRKTSRHQVLTVRPEKRISMKTGNEDMVR